MIKNTSPRMAEYLVTLTRNYIDDVDGDMVRKLSRHFLLYGEGIRENEVIFIVECIIISTSKSVEYCFVRGTASTPLDVARNLCRPIVRKFG